MTALPRTASGPASSDPVEVEIRPAETRDEFIACVDLQRDIWGHGFSDVVPLSMLQITAKMKGIVTGAFGPGGTLYGFVYGVTGIRYGELAHWSHMLAVRPGARDQGIGRRLKLAQRQELRAAGVRTMYWTYDPLVARNAHLNLNLLGATVDEFVQDMYGESDSELHQLGTDRFIVKWDLTGAGERNAERAERQVDGARAARAGSSAVNPDAAASWHPAGAPDETRPVLGAGADEPIPLPDADVIEVVIPRDIGAVEARSFEEALGWRRSTRRVLGHFLNASYDVGAFIPGEKYCKYIVSRTP